MHFYLYYELHICTGRWTIICHRPEIANNLKLLSYRSCNLNQHYFIFSLNVNWVFCCMNINLSPSNGNVYLCTNFYNGRNFYVRYDFFVTYIVREPTSLTLDTNVNDNCSPPTPSYHCNPQLPTHTILTTYRLIDLSN